MSARREEQESHHLVGSYIGSGKGEAFGTALYVTGWNDLANRTVPEDFERKLRHKAVRHRSEDGCIPSKNETRINIVFFGVPPPLRHGTTYLVERSLHLQCYVYH